MQEILIQLIGLIASSITLGMVIAIYFLRGRLK